jgi:hypothetical protein
MRPSDSNHQPDVYDAAFIFAAIAIGVFIALWFVTTHRYHLCELPVDLLNWTR